MVHSAQVLGCFRGEKQEDVELRLACSGGGGLTCQRFAVAVYC